MWFLPSRSRPANIVRLIQAWHDMKSSTPLLLMLDADDPKLTEYHQIQLPDTWKIYVFPVRRPVGAMFNDALALYPDEPWYGGLGDDGLPRTPYWDVELVKTAGTHGLAYPDDGIKGEVLSTHIVAGGEFIRKLGWIILPGLDRLYGDAAIMAAAKRWGSLHYRGDVKLEHLHFSNNQAAFDEVYKKPSAMRDRQVYDDWLWSIDPTTIFITLRRRDEYSAAHVNILFDMIARNLPSDFGRQFVCFTDDPQGLDAGIETKPLPAQRGGDRLYMFNEGLIEEGKRVMFLAPDTMLLGDIMNIASYRGDCALLRDFQRPERLNIDVMLWRGGFGAGLWDSWVAGGMPDMPDHGASLIERGRRKPDVLQDMYLNAFGSYEECGQLGPPKSTKILSFPGNQKPQDLKDSWVAQVWKKGGKLERAADNEDDPVAHVKHALTLPFPRLEQTAAQDNHHVCLVGGGPSLPGQLEELRKRQNEGQQIWALEGSYPWLAENGIAPDVHVLTAARKESAAFVPEETKATLLYASQCHPDVFAKAASGGKRVLVWHPQVEGIRAALGTAPALIIGGGTTAGMLAIGLAYTLGCRQLHLFGFDSSYEKQQASNQNDPDNPSIEVKVGDRVFFSSPRLAQQVNELRMLLKQLIPQGLQVSLHGEGLLPYVMEKVSQARATSKN